MQASNLHEYVFDAGKAALWLVCVGVGRKHFGNVIKNRLKDRVLDLIG